MTVVMAGLGPLSVILVPSILENDRSVLFGNFLNLKATVYSSYILLFPNILKNSNILSQMLP